MVSHGDTGLRLHLTVSVMVDETDCMDAAIQAFAAPKPVVYRHGGLVVKASAS